MDEAKLQNMIDTTEIIQVLNKYGVIIDAFAWDLLDEVFTEDCVVDMGPAGTTWRSLKDITAGFDVFEGTLDNHKHTMYGHVVEVHGDTATAFTYSDWILVRYDATKIGDDSYWTGHGWYNDTLVRTEKGWRIKTRTTRMMKYFGNAYVSQPVAGQIPTNDTCRLRELDKEGKVLVLGDMRAKPDYQPYTLWEEVRKTWG